MTDDSTRWMSIREAALALGVSDLTIRRRIKDGKIVHRLVNGKYFVDVHENGQESSSQSDQSNGKLHNQPSLISPDIDEAEVVRTEPSLDVGTDQTNEKHAGNGYAAPSINIDALLADYRRVAQEAGRAATLEARVRELEDRQVNLQESMLSLANRNGWLESKLEEREQDIKLLTDSRRKRGWFRRVFGGGQG